MSVGLTRLEEEDGLALGWGVELSLRVLGNAPPPAGVLLLRELADQIVRCRGQGDSPESVDVEVPPGAVLLREEPVLRPLVTRAGTVRFVQVVPIAEAELLEDVDDVAARMSGDHGIWAPELDVPPRDLTKEPLVFEGEARSVEEAWGRIELALERLEPGMSSRLAPGTTKRAIDTAEAALLAPLPRSLREFFARHDGETEYLNAFGCWEALSLAEAVREARDAAHYLPAGAIPFASNGSGDFMVVDVRGVLGRGAGAIASAYHEGGVAEPAILQATDLVRWLDSTAGMVARAELDEDGLIRLQEDDRFIRRLEGNPH